jgi:hypothetical protein
MAAPTGDMLERLIIAADEKIVTRLDPNTPEWMPTSTWRHNGVCPRVSSAFGRIEPAKSG